MSSNFIKLKVAIEEWQRKGCCVGVHLSEVKRITKEIQRFVDAPVLKEDVERIKKGLFRNE